LLKIQKGAKNHERRGKRGRQGPMSLS